MMYVIYQEWPTGMAVFWPCYFVWGSQPSLYTEGVDSPMAGAPPGLKSGNVTFSWQEDHLVQNLQATFGAAILLPEQDTALDPAVRESSGLQI